MKIRFNRPTDGFYDQGTVHQFDDHVAELYVNRGVAEDVFTIAKRLAADVVDPKTSDRASVELNNIMHELTDDQAAIVRNIADLAISVTAQKDAKSFEQAKADKMLKGTDPKLKKKTLQKA